MSLCTLRLRGPSGVSTVQLSPDASLLELRAAILSSTDILPEKQELRTGIPPRPLYTPDENATLAQLGIKHGDVIIVQEGTGNISSSASVAIAPVATLKTASSLPPVKSTYTPTSTVASPSSSATDKLSSPRSGGGDGQQGNILDKPFDAEQKKRYDSGQDSEPNGTPSATNPNQQEPTANAKSDSEYSANKPDSAAPGRNSRPQQPPLPAWKGTTASGAKPGLSSTEDAHVRVDGGWMVLRVVPDDNSCLFTALSVCLKQGKPEEIVKLRQTVADAILNDPHTWSDAVLGMSPDQYCQRIVKPSTWGGAIELAILSQIYSTEINSIDVQSNRVDRFGEERGYSSQIFLIYSGIHYDAVTFTPIQPDPSSMYPYDLSFDQTVFSPTSDGFALAASQELARKLRDRRYYTDTAGFALRCEVCKKALKGEKEAQSHAKQTGHTNFGEF